MQPSLCVLYWCSPVRTSSYVHGIHPQSLTGWHNLVESGAIYPQPDGTEYPNNLIKNGPLSRFKKKNRALLRSQNHPPAFWGMNCALHFEEKKYLVLSPLSSAPLRSVTFSAFPLHHHFAIADRTTNGENDNFLMLTVLFAWLMRTWLAFQPSKYSPISWFWKEKVVAVRGVCTIVRLVS